MKGAYRMKSLLLLCSLFIGLIREPALAADNQLTKDEAKQGWILLFDGKTLNGWMTSDSKPSQRPVEDGTINPHNSGAYMLVTKKEFGDFKLQLNFKLSPHCNSGVFFRVYSLTPKPGKDVGYNGIEVAIDDTKTASYVDPGAIYDLSKPTKNALRPLGEWNHLVLTSQDNRAIVELNGEVVNNVDFNKFTESDKRPDGTPHKFGVAFKDFPRRGRIGLQDHGADIWFKNIKLLPLGERKSAGNAASLRRVLAVSQCATMP
jgi:alpha-3'-ketoglucosidase